MVQSSSGYRQTPARHVTRAIAVLLIALSAVITTATAASAVQSCHFVIGQSNACLTITYNGSGIYTVHLGVDVYMSQADAQAILAAPGNAFSAKLIGDDPGSHDPVLFDVPLVWEASATAGIGAELARNVSGSWLNEDSGEDELYGRISLFDARTGLTRTFTTGVIVGNYS